MGDLGSTNGTAGIHQQDAIKKKGNDPTLPRESHFERGTEKYKGSGEAPDGCLVLVSHIERI